MKDGTAVPDGWRKLEVELEVTRVPAAGGGKPYRMAMGQPGLGVKNEAVSRREEIASGIRGREAGVAM